MAQSTTTSTRTFQPRSENSEPKKPSAPKPKRPRRLPKLRLGPWLLVALLLIFSLFMVYEYHQAKQKVHSNNSAAANKQVASTIAQVSKLIILPAGEKPTVATVVHANKLHGQAFFKDAHDGDKVLVYNQARQAYLYRPGTNQLVNVSHVTLTPTAGAAQPTP